ncbi:methyltransferase domain-containing protein [Serinibacter salmoneus]|uniref:methyltransferase domain-containing protein n=1 Tax=Serinibacter salmoneus TaxID=556530 RepID=UPI000BF8F007|nr:methyltransferase domain-containing protein [Serinibacter salmoneus]
MRCDYYERAQCRSCALLPLGYDAEIARKETAVREVLDGVAPAAWFPTVRSPQARFRNKAKLAVGGTLADPLLGIQQPGGVQDLTRCPLHTEAIEAALPALRTFITRASLAPYDVAARAGELKFALVTAAPGGQLMVRFVLRSTEAQARIRKHLPWLLDQVPGLALVSLNILPEHKAVLEGEREIVLHGETLTMPLNGLPLHLRPQSFFQTNTPVAEALYREATAWLVESAPRSLWDLYCGVGGFALHAARALPGLAVRGVEVSAEAIASARRTAAEMGLTGARFEVGDATALGAGPGEQVPDAVVVNPPRRGLGADLAATLERSGVDTVLYSSCNAASLARDLAAMPSLRVTRARLFDMFPHTDHGEVLVELRRHPGDSQGTSTRGA